MKKLSIIILSALFLSACGSGGTNNDETAENAKSVITCSNGWSKYSATGIPMTFCHDQTWGDVVIAEQDVSAGKLFKISFSKLAEGGPTVWYESFDYSGAGDDSYHLDSRAIRITGSDDMVKKQLIEELNFPFTDDEFKLRKSDVGAVHAIRIHVDTGDLDYVEYYVPAAFEGYNVILSATQEYAEDIDDLAFDMSF